MDCSVKIGFFGFLKDSFNNAAITAKSNDAITVYMLLIKKEVCEISVVSG